MSAALATIEANKIEIDRLQADVEKASNNTNLTEFQRESIISELRAQIEALVDANRAATLITQQLSGDGDLEALVINSKEELESAQSAAAEGEAANVQAATLDITAQLQQINNDISALEAILSPTEDEKTRLTSLIEQQQILTSELEQNLTVLDNLQVTDPQILEALKQIEIDAKSATIQQSYQVLEQAITEQQNQLKNINKELFELVNDSTLSPDQKIIIAEQLKLQATEIMSDVESNTQKFLDLDSSGDVKVEVTNDSGEASLVPLVQKLVNQDLASEDQLIKDLSNTISSFDTANFKSPDAVQNFRIQELSSSFVDIKVELSDIKSKIDNIQSQKDLSKTEKLSRTTTLQNQANELKKQVDANWEELSLISNDQQLFENSKTEIEDIKAILEVIQSLGLVEVEINFSDIFGSPNTLKAASKLILPIKFKSQTFNLKIDPSDLQNHQKIKNLIARELQIHTLEDNHQVNDDLRLQELKRLQLEKQRSLRENDYNPATATRDGYGVILPITVR